jgi:hypothetical protein
MRFLLKIHMGHLLTTLFAIIRLFLLKKPVFQLLILLLQLFKLSSDSLFMILNLFFGSLRISKHYLQFLILPFQFLYFYLHSLEQ